MGLWGGGDFVCVRVWGVGVIVGPSTESVTTPFPSPRIPRYLLRYPSNPRLRLSVREGSLSSGCGGNLYGSPSMRRLCRRASVPVVVSATTQSAPRTSTLIISLSTSLPLTRLWWSPGPVQEDSCPVGLCQVPEEGLDSDPSLSPVPGRGRDPTPLSVSGTTDWGPDNHFRQGW